MSQPSCTVTKALTPRWRISSRRREAEETEFVLSREIGVDDSGLALGAAQQFGQAMIALRPDDDVDGALAAVDFGAFGLRDAARDDDLRRPARFRPRGLQRAQASEFGKDLLGGAFADVAGIQDDEVGVFDGGRLGIAFGAEKIAHALGVIDVHLAAERLHEQLARARRLGFLSGAAGLPSIARRHRQIIELRHHPRDLRGLKPRTLILRRYDARATPSMRSPVFCQTCPPKSSRMTRALAGGRSPLR